VTCNSEHTRQDLGKTDRANANCTNTVLSSRLCQNNTLHAFLVDLPDQRHPALNSSFNSMVE
jgi:hypothetical protein